MLTNLKKALAPYRTLAALAALALAGVVLWYGTIFALAGRSGLALQDLAGERSALDGVTVEGAVRDNLFRMDFTLTGAGVQNRFSPQYAAEEAAQSRGYYDSVTLQPAPGANTSAPQQTTDGAGNACWQITTDEIAFYINVWGAEGRDLALFDSGLRLAAPAGGRFTFCSGSVMIGAPGPQIWQLAVPGEAASEADQQAGRLAREFSCKTWRTRAGQREFLALTANGETRVFCIERWGSSTQVAAAGAEGTGMEFLDYSRPIGSVSPAAVLPGKLEGAAPAGQDGMVLVLCRQNTLVAAALDEAGAVTDETFLLSLPEGQEQCEVHFCSPAKTSHADIGLVLYPDNTEQTAGPPWAGSCAAALRVENGKFTVKELLRLEQADAAAQFLGAGLSEDGQRLVTVQQRLPRAAEQPPAGLWKEDTYLAGEVSVAVWKQGQRLYEGVLAGDWRQDAWRAFWQAWSPRRSCRFGQADPYGSEALAAYCYFMTGQEVALQ